MDTNLFEDLLYKLESQIKKEESEIKIRQGVVLSEIETMLESAANVSEIIKFEKQYDEAEKKFGQEILKQKRKIIQEHMAALEKLVKHIKKKYREELMNNNLKKVKPKCKK